MCHSDIAPLPTRSGEATRTPWFAGAAFLGDKRGGIPQPVRLSGYWRLSVLTKPRRVASNVFQGCMDELLIPQWNTITKLDPLLLLKKI